MSLRVLVFGAGALGQAVGTLLAAAGHRVDLILRERFRSVVAERGLRVEGIFGDHAVDAGGIGTAVDIGDDLDRVYDFVLITTKSYDTVRAAQAVRRLASQGFHVVSMQNGCGNLETLMEHFGPERALAARVITGFEIPEPGRVRITVTADDVHVGGAVDGRVPPEAKRLADVIRKAGLPCIETAHIRRDLWAKLLYNCALNPLGAVLRVPYGRLPDDRGTRRIMDRIIDETFAVIAASGASTHWPDAPAYREVFYGTLVPATANHRPSMLQDLEAGKRTEVDALTGFVSAEGRRYGVATPACDMVSDLVRFLDATGPSPKP